MKWTNETLTFNKCPCCKSERGVCKEALNAAKEAGWAGLDARFTIIAARGAVLDKRFIPSIPIGAGLPAVKVEMDICHDCGCIYATEIVKEFAHLNPAPAIPPMPPRFGNPN